MHIEAGWKQIVPSTEQVGCPSPPQVTISVLFSLGKKDGTLSGSEDKSVSESVIGSVL
jgi:hypothetical protein